MKYLLPVIFILISNFSFGQTNGSHSCKVEIYLLKRVIPNADSTKEARKQFKVSLSDLQDTAFIKDAEILNYAIKRDTDKSVPGKIYFRELYSFKVSAAAVKRITDLHPPLCCGVQFAVVANGQICYAGYFWNIFSSWGCEWITASAHDTSIDVIKTLPGKDPIQGPGDPMYSPLLVACLTSTNRLTKNW